MTATEGPALYKRSLEFSWIHAAVLLLILFALIFPFYQYILDIDAVGYISVARHYAAGDWHLAINGYWSPLNSWLMVPFVKLGFNDILCFKVANVFFGIGALYQTEKMLEQFSFSPKQKTGILLTVTVMLLYYSSIQLAADMLFVWIFLIYVNASLVPGLHSSTRLNARLGLIAAIGFFAKTYGGVFFILHFSFLHFIWFPFIQKKGWHLKQYGIGLLAFMPLVIVWMVLLWNKYHLITFGYSGQLNWSWVLKGGQPDYKDFFYFPPYDGAVSRWVDPFYAQVKNYSPFQSKELMGRGLKLVGFNVKNSLSAAMWISFLSPLLVTWLFIKRRLHPSLEAIAVIILIFPLVYLLIFMEERYLWPLSIPLLVASGYLLKGSPFQKKWLWALLSLSFVTGPGIRLVDAMDADKEAAQLVTIIRQNNLKGRFTAMDSGEWMHKAAFVTGNQYLPLVRPPKSWDEVEAECTANNISAICIEKFGRDDAINFLATDFYQKHKANAIQVEGRYLWVIRLK
ncbi:MAG: hypothetical protein V4722_17735 [Bacteroidota bacterium]